MGTTQEERQSSSSSWFCCPKKPKEIDEKQQKSGMVKMKPKKNKKPGGWKSMPFIIGNETFERLAAFGVLANFMVYLKREYHLNQVASTNLISVYSGVANFAPLIGAFVSDAFIGRFWTIAFGSVASFLGMMSLTLTAWIPSLRPAPCQMNYQKNNESLQVSQMGLCEQPNGTQLGFLVLTLGLLCIGTGGIRPCSIPFGVDQFDHSTDEGRRGISSYYNWYYTTFTLVIMLTLTVVVYIQDSVSWIIGFGIPTILMFCSIFLFFFGKRLYVYVNPEGSIFSSIFRVFVAAYKKRALLLPSMDTPKPGVFYDPPLSTLHETKLPFTTQFRFLSKAGIIQEGEIEIDGKPTEKSRWTLCSIQEIEEVKCLIRVLPIWASGIICFTSAIQQSTFIINQAITMNRHIGSKFQVPPGSIIIISLITIGVWVPIYDRIVVPSLRKITKHEEGFTLLQRMGIGLIFSILSMIIAGLVEQKRRNFANLDHHRELSFLWLIPQLAMVGLAEGFNFIGQIEFYNKQFPEKLSSMATSLFFCTIAGASYLNTAVVSLVHGFTGGHGKPDWLTDDINQGRLDYFYYLLAIMGCFNLVYFLVCATKYQYKGDANVQQVKDFHDVELSLASK